MLVQPDFSEAQEPITAGEYKVRVTGCEQKTSQKGAPYLRWELTTFASEEPKDDGRKMWHTTMISGRGAGMLKQFYQVCTGESLEGNFDTEQLLGREFVAVVALDDKGYTNVKGMKPIQ